MYSFFIEGIQSKFLGSNPRARILSQSTNLKMCVLKYLLQGRLLFLVMGYFWFVLF